jgi:phenylacetate-CoA ligase
MEFFKNKKAVRYCYSLLPEYCSKGYKTYEGFRRLIKDTEYLTKNDIRKFQFNKLQEIVRYAWNNIHGYRELWDDASFCPDKLKCIDDIRLIPFITKEILRDNLDKFSNKKIILKKYATTGGSTGIPLGFYQEKKNDFIETAFIHDMWSRHYPKISRKTKSTILRGRNVDGIFNYDPMYGLTLSSYDIDLVNVIKYIELIESYKTPIFQAYPSAIYLMANIIKDNNININHKFKAIMLGSEPLYDFQKKLIQETFNTKLCFWYGASEKVVLAGNCELDERFHIYPQYGITEIIDKNGRTVNEGESGEIVGTSFWNFATPLIRYKTMDYAERGAERCEKCGRHYSLLNKIDGRLQDYIVDRERRLVTLTALIFAQHFQAFSRMISMKLYQDKIGEVIVNIVPTQAFTPEDEIEIIHKMQEATHNKITVYIKIVESLDLTESGKMKFLDQRLKIEEFL